MKAVVAEASSISKAIELAWQKAGQPKEFLTKIFQEPQRNMFGLTKTAAKVGIFFEDASITQKIKVATQNTTTNSQPVKNITPLSPIKPINNKPQVNKPVQINKQEQKQVKNEPTINTTNKNVAPVAKNISEKPLVKQTNAINPNQPRKNNQNITQPNPQNIKPVSNHPTEQSPVMSQPVHQAEPAQPIVNNQSNSQTTNLTIDQNAIATQAPKPARSKYYRRRKPKKAVSSEHGEQNKPINPAHKNEN